MSKHFSALLTDMDGTLIHSQLPICEAIQIAFEAVGECAPSIEQLLNMFGLPVEQMLVALSRVTEEESERIDAFIAEYKRQYLKKMVRARLIDGVVDTLKLIRDKGYPICLITSERRSNVEFIMNRQGLDKYLTHYVTRDEVTLCKPDPQPILAAAQAVGCKPEDCLYIGESPFDLKAGLNASVFTVGVASGNWSWDSLVECEPDCMVSSFAQIRKYFM